MKLLLISILGPITVLCSEIPLLQKPWHRHHLVCCYRPHCLCSVSKQRLLVPKAVNWCYFVSPKFTAKVFYKIQPNKSKSLNRRSQFWKGPFGFWTLMLGMKFILSRAEFSLWIRGVGFSMTTVIWDPGKQRVDIFGMVYAQCLILQLTQVSGWRFSFVVRLWT